MFRFSFMTLNYNNTENKFIYWYWYLYVRYRAQKLPATCRLNLDSNSRFFHTQHKHLLEFHRQHHQIIFEIQISTTTIICVPVLEINWAYVNEKIYICSWVKRFWNQLYIYICTVGFLQISIVQYKDLLEVNISIYWTFPQHLHVHCPHLYICWVCGSVLLVADASTVTIFNGSITSNWDKFQKEKCLDKTKLSKIKNSLLFLLPIRFD